MSALEHARELAAHGFRVAWIHVPIGDGCSCGRADCTKSRGKHPILPRWQKRATHDVAELEEQFASLDVAEPNVGIVLGPQPDGSYLVAVDIDDQKRFEVLERELGPLPETRAIASARGDKRLYRIPEGTDIERLRNVGGLTSDHGKPVGGVDVKCRDGQVVAPGSVHASGAKYYWRTELPIAELPSPWVEAIQRPPYIPPASPTTSSDSNAGDLVKRARRYIDAMPPAIEFNGGNRATFNVARKLLGFVAKGLSLAEAWSLLLEWNTQLASPWTERQLRKVLDDAIAEAKHVAPPPDRPPRRGSGAAHPPAWQDGPPAGFDDGLEAEDFVPLDDLEVTPSAAVSAPELVDEERAAIQAEASRSKPRHAGLTAEVLDAARTKPPTFPLLLGVDIAQHLPPLEYLVREIGLTAGSGAPHIIAGYGFSGKTIAMQSLLLSLAAGRGVWGGYTGRPSKVIHVDLEQGRRLDCTRYQRLAFAMGINLLELEDRLALLARPRLTLRSEHRGHWLSLMQGRDFLLVDSLRAATGGLDENSSEIREPLDLLGDLSEETGCRAAVILHARKPSDDKPGGRYSIRGSSAIYDACDCCYIFGAEKGEPISVVHDKAREAGETVQDFALVVADVTDEKGADPRAGVRVQVHGRELIAERRETKKVQSRVAAAKQHAETVRKAIGDKPGIHTTPLRSGCGLDSAQFQAAMAELGDQVERRDVKEGRSWKVAHYLRGVAP